MPDNPNIIDNDSEEPILKPEIWWFQLPSGNSYWIRDEAARQAIAELQEMISQVMHFRGRTLTELYDGATTSPIILVDDPTHPYTPQNGDVVTYRQEQDSDSDSDSEEPVRELEFAWTGHHWQEYGSSGALKALAFKDTASSPYTPQGSINEQAFTGHPVDYTPAGVNTGANVTLTHDTVNSITDVGTLPVLPTFTVTDGKLIITGGNPGTLPTKGADQTVAVDVDTITQPTFTGTQAQITAEGEVEQAQFTGTPTTITVS